MASQKREQAPALQTGFRRHDVKRNHESRVTGHVSLLRRAEGSPYTRSKKSEVGLIPCLLGRRGCAGRGGASWRFRRRRSHYETVGGGWRAVICAGVRSRASGKTL